MTQLPPLALAEQMADRARTLIRPYFRTRLPVQDKADTSPVTIADQETEAALRALLHKHYPDHSIIGEEHGREQKNSDYTWIIDPIDGTKSFISGMPTFGTLICLAEQGTPVLGVVDMPMLDERWQAERGQGAFYNGAPCRTSDVSELADALLYCTEPTMFDAAQWERFSRLTEQVRLRRFGGDCYNYGLLASGHIDLVVEGDLKIYDVMALIPIIEEAGGVITDWRGRPVGAEDWDGCVVAAATPELHRKALAVLQGA